MGRSGLFALLLQGYLKEKRETRENMANFIPILTKEGGTVHDAGGCAAKIFKLIILMRILKLA